MRLLTCVISYNRYHFPRNTVDSFREFFRFGDLAVIDNGSDEHPLVAYLEELEGHGIRVERQKGLHSRRSLDPVSAAGGVEAQVDASLASDRPGFVSAAKKALEIGLASGYDYVQILPDDIQFVWHDSDILDKISHVFSVESDVTVLNPSFFGRQYLALANVEYRTESRTFRHKWLPMTDCGIVPASRIAEHGFRFIDTPGNREYWGSRGYRSYFLAEPIAAYVPWPPVVRAGLRTGFYRAPPNKYYLKPLDQGRIRQLANPSSESLPFEEDYCMPWNWAALRPYGLTSMDYADFVHGVAACWRRRDWQIPHWGFSGFPKFFVPNPIVAAPALAWSAAWQVGNRAARKLLGSGRR